MKAKTSSQGTLNEYSRVAIDRLPQERSNSQCKRCSAHLFWICSRALSLCSTLLRPLCFTKLNLNSKFFQVQQVHTQLNLQVKKSRSEMISWIINQNQTENYLFKTVLIILSIVNVISVFFKMNCTKKTEWEYLLFNDSFVMSSSTSLAFGKLWWVCVSLFFF